MICLFCEIPRSHPLPLTMNKNATITVGEGFSPRARVASRVRTISLPSLLRPQLQVDSTGVVLTYRKRAVGGPTRTPGKMNEVRVVGVVNRSSGRLSNPLLKKPLHTSTCGPLSALIVGGCYRKSQIAENWSLSSALFLLHAGY